MNMSKSAILLLALGFLAPSVSAQSLLVIVNKSNKVDNLSLKELSKISKAEKQRWKGGHKIALSVTDLKSTAGKVFLKTVYKGSEDDYNKFWLAKVFRGEAQAPEKLKSAVEVITFIKNHPNGIGFVSSEKKLDLSEVKILQIDGKLAVDSTYALR